MHILLLLQLDRMPLMQLCCLRCMLLMLLLQALLPTCLQLLLCFPAAGIALSSCHRHFGLQRFHTFKCFGQLLSQVALLLLTC